MLRYAISQYGTHQQNVLGSLFKLPILNWLKKRPQGASDAE